MTKGNQLQDIRTFLDAYDLSANRKKKVFLRVWYSGIFSGVLAVIIFALITIYKEYLGEDLKGLILPITEVLFILYSFITLSLIAPKMKSTFIDSRRIAEILRIHELFSRNGLPLKPSVFELKEHKVPPNILSLENQNNNSTSLQEQKLKNILKDFKNFIEGQNKYHKSYRIQRFERREHLLKNTLHLILWSFLAIILLKLGVEILKYLDYQKVIGINLKGALYLFKFSVIFLPPLYAAFEGFHYFSEWRRNIRISKNVNKEYNTLSCKIDLILKDEQIYEKQVMEIADELYHLFHNENQNWYKWYSSRKIEARI